MDKSEETWKPLRIVIVIGLIVAGVLALIPGQQEHALHVLIVTPIAVSTVSGILLLRIGKTASAICYLLSVALVLGIALFQTNGR